MLVFIESDKILTPDMADKIKAEVERQLGPGYKVVVLGGGLTGRVFYPVQPVLPTVQIPAYLTGAA